MRSLLIANRAEIARRVTRTARELGLRTVGVYTDADAMAPHAREVDVAYRIGSYLDVEELVALACRAGADAVHPGYGFLSERAPAARAFAEAGVTWVGPPPDVIAALGDKVRAKELMAAAGVPVLPGGLVADVGDVGFPVLIKAAAGGGGRGMRLVEQADGLGPAVEAASREALASFGDGTVFLERWLPAPRHIEVQVMADSHGNVVHLGERECSLQRRHQKVIEESPAPGLGAALRARMVDAAVAGARTVGYTGAGTWEFLVDGDEFFFLEVNARLQVEHPVTELVTGLDLVALQLGVAAGDPLPIGQEDVVIRGHAIEARLVAEDPLRGWLPSTGTLHRLVPALHPEVRYDLGFASGDVIGPDYDSLLGKVIAHRPTRAGAAATLALALDGLEVHGVETNRAFLAEVLREPDFLAGDTTTGYFEGHPDLGASAPPATAELIGAALWLQAVRRAHATVLATLPSGWRNVRTAPQRVSFLRGETAVDVSYELDGSRWRGAVGDEALTGSVLRVDPAGIDLEVDGRRVSLRCEQVADSVWAGSPQTQVTLVEVPRFGEGAAAAGGGAGPTAPVPGTVIAVEVAVGDTVQPGQTLVVLEAMKLEHRVRAEADGVVAAIPVVVGQRVDAREVLVVIEPA